MHFTDEAIVLSVSKYGENSGIACILTRDYGVYKGLVRGISGNRQRGTYQPGNIIDATWRARLPEHLGNISAETIHISAMNIMHEPLALAALSSLCALLSVTLQEREPAMQFYNSCRELLNQFSKSAENWQKSYVLLEMELLAMLGYGLDLTACAATGSVEELIYVSPKSGRAVCREAGKPYHDKMLKLPEFLLQKDTACSQLQIKDGILLCGYFLEKYFFTPHNILQPQARVRFVGMLGKV